ncbi:YqjK-like family protein [Raoultella ornithinolytica]|uniref:YqjK-like family protein n=1 Tax=Raoultella ornithinolytica TaxID=54291 RepID=UPI00384AE0D1
MNSKQQREQRKALLLRQIQQQRLDLIASRRDWLEATAPFDRGWLTLQHLRSWAVVSSGIMAVWSVRHPRFLLRWTKRGFGLWSAWRMAKRLLRQTSSL